MVYRLARQMPQHGSTDWGAAQIYHLLDEEERVAAERRRLLSMGWRPPALAEDAGAPPAGADQHFILAANPSPSPGGSGRLNVPPYLLPYIQTPEHTPANTNIPPASTLNRTPTQASPAKGEIPRPAVMNGSFEAQQAGDQDRERAIRHFYTLVAREMRIEEQARNRERALELLKARKAGDSAPQGGKQALDPLWSLLAEIGDWIPFSGRDIPEDDDYCLRRWEAEQDRCLRWPLGGPRGKCLERAAIRHDLCFRNGGRPDPDEPDEWSEADMERWYNPHR